MTTVCRLESPEYVQTSLAGAMALGLEPGRFYRNACPGTLNLLLTYEDGCRANCSYCGLARERSQVDMGQTFIRVKWPQYSLAQITGILKRQALSKPDRQFGRICVSMITHPRAADDSLAIVRKLRAATSIPISVLVSPTLIADTKAFFTLLKQAGADRVGVAVDAATPDLFAALRGKAVRGPHQWDKYWQTVEDAVRVFGRNYASIHLIVGVGETEAEMVRTIARAHECGAQAHLFSFCPEPGSALGDKEAPPLGQYRRIQLAAYLINYDIAVPEEFTFNTDGQIAGFGRPLEELLGADLAGGKPFMTSGCPDNKGCVACNRPYGNERPGPVLRNYPFVPETDDMKLVRSQIWDGLKEDCHAGQAKAV